MEDNTRTRPYRRRLKQLNDDFDSWKPQFIEIADYMLPRKGRYLTSTDAWETNKGTKKHQKIINGTATDALEILAAGMQSGLTSPSRPWFILTLANKELMEYAPVKIWLDSVRDMMLAVYQKSNFYDSVHGLYLELGAFGTGSLLIDEDFKSIIRCRPFTIGEYYLALDATYRPSMLYRRFDLTARQAVEHFGEDAVSDSIKTAFKDNSEKRFSIIHAIEPNTDRDMQRGGIVGMEFVSKYFEEKGDQNVFLLESGYNTIPFVAPRWKVTGVDTYGGSRGMDALGDVKMLQKMEEKTLKALDKLVDPPMNAPTSMKKKGANIIPGGVNYVDATQGQQTFAPAYQINPDIKSIEFKIDRVEQRIQRFFFNDLFLSVLQTDKTMTATEVAERHTEKLLMLGPVLERLQSELLDVVIERTYGIMDSLDMLPAAPRELQGVDVKIEYISLLAQAQKAVGLNAISQTAEFVAGLANVSPNVVDKFDADEAVDQYADGVGIAPKIIRSDDRVAEIRAVRAEQEAKQRQIEVAAQAADSAKTLSEAKVEEGGSMLDVVGESMKQRA